MDGRDELFSDALDCVIKNKTASVSMLQRRFRIGYTRASNLIEEFEEEGYISEWDDGKPRQVLITENPFREKKETKKKAGKKEAKPKIKHIPELGMNERQKAFCDYYIETANATEAALMAGYSEKTARQMGSENLSKPYIKTYIKNRMEQKEDERIAKQDEILAYLTSIMRGKQREQVLRGVGEGAQVVEDIDVSAKDRIKAAELIGKRYSMWTDKIDMNGTVAVMLVDDVPDED